MPGSIASWPQRFKEGSHDSFLMELYSFQMSHIEKFCDLSFKKLHRVTLSGGIYQGLLVGQLAHHGSVSWVGSLCQYIKS